MIQGYASTHTIREYEEFLSGKYPGISEYVRKLRRLGYKGEELKMVLRAIKLKVMQGGSHGRD